MFTLFLFDFEGHMHQMGDSFRSIDHARRVFEAIWRNIQFPQGQVTNTHTGELVAFLS